MAISRERKEEIIATYADILDRSEGFVVTEYRGMKMKQFNDIRGVLRDTDASLVVTKNRLFKLALNDKGYPVPDSLLTGPVAVSFAHSDMPGMVKALLDRRKEMPLLILKGGLVGGSVFGEEDLDAISKLPSLDELHAQILGLVASAPQGLVDVLNAPTQNLVNVFQAGVGSLASVLAAHVAKQEQGDAA